MSSKVNQINFGYKGFIFKKIDVSEFDDYLKFRYRIFSQELGWLPENEKKLEKDRYDDFGICVHFGCFKPMGKIIACMRIILSSQVGWMIQKEFRNYFGNAPIPRCSDDAIELTRLGIEKQFRIHSSFTILSGLYKITYKWSIINKINRWYFVTSKKFIILLKRMGFSVSIIGEGLKDINNIFTVPGMVDLQKSATLLKKKNINRYNFYHD